MKRIGIVAIVICTLPATAFAALRPHFSARDVGWFATDIVVVSEMEEGGTFQVIEAWKGSLRAGDCISVPGMVEWQAPAKRTFEDATSKPRIIVVTTDRLLLFLKRENTHQTDSKQMVWSPATFRKMWQISFLWLQDGSAYGYQQRFTPGPSSLHEVARNESELRQEIWKFASERDEFDKALTIGDPGQRANAMANFFSSKNPSAWVTALQEIEKIGPAALPALRAALQQPDLLPRHGQIALAMAKVGKAYAGPELVRYIERDADYWAATASRLSPGWWNDEAHAQEVSPDRDRYGADVYALDALIQIRHVPAAAAIQCFCNAWSKVPPLDRSLRESQLLQKCEEALQAFGQGQPVE